LFAINQKKLDLEEEAEAITDLAKREADEIVRQSVKEAEEKDKLKITIMQFFNSI